MNIPYVITKENLDCDSQDKNNDMVTESAITQECVGERQTLSDKNVTRISHSDYKMTQITQPVDLTILVQFANL